jgi:hypothetical protein
MMQSIRQNTQAHGHDAAVKAYNANLPARQRRMGWMRQWVDGTQYEGRANWFSDGEHAPPLLEREPCVVYPAARIAINSNVDLVLGDGRFPEIDVESDGGDEASDEAARECNEAVRKLVKTTKLKAAARRALRECQKVGSTIAIISVRSGKPAIDVPRAEWAEPKFGADGEIESVEIRYPYISEQRSPRGERTEKCLLFRRVIDTENDTTFLPGDAALSGSEPEWKVDATKTFAHGLGFCPVVWHAHMRECDIVETFDGEAIHEGLLDEIFAHDVSLSQRHRASLYVGDPQIVETGVSDIGAIGTTGRMADTGMMPGEVLATMSGGRPSASNPIIGTFGARPGPRVRRKSPGEVWSYDDQNARVSYLTVPADALNVIAENACDLKTKLCESMAVVLIDPENVKFASTLSGKALEALKARQLDRCNQIRDDFWDGWIEPVVRMLCRVCVAKATGLVQRLVEILPGVASVAAGAELEPLWGDYFNPSPDDDQKTVNTVTHARDAKLLSRRRALELLAPVFGTASVDEEERALEDESAEADARAEEAAARQNAALHSAMQLGAQANGSRDHTGAGSGAGPKPGGTPGGGGGAVPAAAPGNSSSKDSGQSRNATGKARR